MQTIRKISLILTLVICGPAWGGFYEGFVHYEQGNYEPVLLEFRPLAEEGNAFAQLYLGIMYDQGHGVPQTEGAM